MKIVYSLNQENMESNRLRVIVIEFYSEVLSNLHAVKLQLFCSFAYATYTEKRDDLENS